MINITIANMDSNNVFRFMDGPPFVTGKLHLGHLSINAIKSVVMTFKKMLNFKCQNKMGYDCHGVPIETIVNKMLDIKTVDDLNKIGITKFNQVCKDMIQSYSEDWKPIYKEIGRDVDFTNVYKTMDIDYMESVWWGFAELYKKNLIYKSHKVVPYSYALQSPLSNSESTQNYKNINTKSIYVRFSIVGFENTYFVAWTTTPWTLPCNVALCVNKNFDYDYVKTESGEIYILGKDTYKNCFKNVKHIKTVKGSELINMKYIPIFPFYDFKNEISKKFFTVIEDDYVKESGNTGTNIVHLSPMFGEDDYRICIKNNIINDIELEQIIPIDSNCNFVDIISKYTGKLVFDINDEIIEELKQFNVCVKTQNITHQYPYCYRTDTPLVYRIYESFYVDIQSIKQKMIKHSEKINFYPKEIGTERFRDWLENAQDWCISRSRYFGTPIPVWISDSKKIIVIDSIESLYKYSSVKVTDLHPEFINDITFEYQGEIYKKIPDVFDCWFESGCVPFAQYHYPFENREMIETNSDYLSDFIAEGIDQTRGWFYTLLVLSTAIFDKKPAQNIIVVGMVLGENGKKISKKDGNFIDSLQLIEKYGADAIRLYLLQSPLTIAEPFSFKINDLAEYKQSIFRLENAVEFLKEHTNNQKINNVEFDEYMYKTTTNPMDCWIITHITKKITEIINHMNKYEISKSVKIVVELIDDIANWYIKFNRDRLKGKCGNDEWKMSTSVLKYIIKMYIKIFHPFAPFVTKKISDDIKFINNFEDFNIDKIDIYNEKYIKTFDLIKRISKLVRSARTQTQTHCSNKTPIKSCVIYTDLIDSELMKEFTESIEIIQTELNIIDITYMKLDNNISYKIVPRRSELCKKYKIIGKAITEKLQEIIVDNKNMEYIDVIVNDINYRITKDEFSYELVLSELDFIDSQDKDIMLRIDFTYDDDVKNKHNLKKFIAQVQSDRRVKKLHVWDKISVEIYKDDFDIIAKNIEYVKQRLECIINVNNYDQYIAERIYESDENKIEYSIVIL
jgi:isoleucyl-tRNA synthetase